jgi:hypothetical protein
MLSFGLKLVLEKEEFPKMKRALIIILLIAELAGAGKP